MIDKPLSMHFRLSEFLHSETAVRLGLDNDPPDTVLANIEVITAPGMQRIRDILGCPINISSGYRSPEVNARVGGAANSAHTKGLAVDFTAPTFGLPRTICRRMMETSNRVLFDQLIFEGTWVHVGFPAAGQKARGEVLTAVFKPGQPTTYVMGVG